MKRMAKMLAWSLFTLVMLVAATWTAFRVSPWPDVWLLRHATLVLGDQGAKSAAALEKHVPPGVESHLDVSYGLDPDERMDVFLLSHANGSLATIVWVHGGAFVAGTKSDIRPYLAMLAAHGYTVVGIEYGKAPEHPYPTAVLQLGQALMYLQTHALEFHVDPNRFVLAGDSAGAQMAAQEAVAISNPAYASAAQLPAVLHREQLRGVILFSGPYDLSLISFQGKFGNLSRHLMWAYFSQKDFEQTPGYKYASVVNFVTADFPPSFISTGNGDPLLSHSQRLAQALQRKGASVDTLLFPDANPPLPHEYQFNLDSDGGQQALAKILQHLATWTSPEALATPVTSAQ